MTPKRLEQIDELFQAARKIERSRRAEFLDHSCQDDAELRVHVAELLAADESDSTFTVDSTVSSHPHSRLRFTSLSLGTRLADRYEILDRLGAGGMGHVY